jgi:hypothetical protein
MVTSRQRQHHRPSPSAKPSQDPLQDITVGDTDPTWHYDEVNKPRLCRFEWTDETSPTLPLLWTCTRERRHPGRHIAGTGEQVAAVQSEKDITKTAPSPRIR